jgi:AraC family ethanolamine operon transcriptional activator
LSIQFPQKLCFIQGLMKTHIFQDFDEFAASVRGVEAVMILQNPLRHSWAVDEVVLPEISVQIGRLGSGNIIEGQGSPDGYVIYLPLTDACAYSANGIVLGKGSFAIFEPGCDFCFSTKFEHDWCTIFVPSHKFARVGDLVAPSSGAKKSACRVTREERRVANRFRTLVGQTMTAAVNCSQFEQTRAAISVEAELLKVASAVVGQRQAGEPNPQGRPRLPRQEVIRRCTELLDERDGETVRVGELATAADVSERTLQNVFREYYGVGPVRYFQLRQCHQIRRALRAADPEAVSVVDVLARHGEWQFGRFASRYHQLFGELPSETLRAKTKR